MEGVCVWESEHDPSEVETLAQDIVSFDPISVHVDPPSVEYLCSRPVPFAIAVLTANSCEAPAFIDLPLSSPVTLPPKYIQSPTAPLTALVALFCTKNVIATLLPLLSTFIFILPIVPPWPSPLFLQPFVAWETAGAITGQLIVIVESVASDWLNPSEVLATEYLIITAVPWLCAGTEREELSVEPAATVAVLRVV